MAVVTSDFLASTLTSFRALFAREFSAAEALEGWKEFAIEMPSDGEGNEYTWFGTVPQMQDVTHDQVALRGLEQYNFTIRNKEYQAAIEVERAALERDRLNLITPRINQLAGEAARHPGQLLLQLMETNPDAYDGEPFFSDTREIGESGNLDNIVTQTGTSIAAFQTDLATARGVLRATMDDRGRALNLIGNTIMIPPELEQIAWQALNVGQAGLQDRAALPATANGMWSASGYRVVVNPFLTEATDWYLFHVGGPTMRPFVYQVEKAPVLESDTNPNTRENILKRKFLYSVYGRYAVGVTDPRLGVKVA